MEKHIHHNQNDSDDQSGIRKLPQDLRHPAWEIMLQCFPNDFEHSIFATGEKKRGRGERFIYNLGKNHNDSKKNLEIVLKHHLRALSGWEPNV